VLKTIGRTALLILVVLIPGAALFAQEEGDLGELSLEELLELPIITASNITERLSDAPATVIVVSRREIEERGYSDVSEVLSDLPGMDVVRPYGATYFKNYWRGYRNSIGDPYLIMIDGVSFNHLYFNTADVLVTFPLSNLDRVEVVYGPASSVYGANAFMGVINLITRSGIVSGETKSSVQIGAGSHDQRQGDVSILHGFENGAMRVTGRIDRGNLDGSHADGYEYTRERYYSDRSLWGGFVDNPSIAGAFSSPRRHTALDLRMILGNTEIAAQYFDLQSGYGVEYAADRVQNNAVWSRPDMSIYLRNKHKLSERLSGQTMARYRRSDVENESFFLESNPGPTAPLVDFSYWQSLNSSWSLQQDFHYRASALWSITTGFRFEEKDLQKAYDANYGPSVPADIADGSTYPYPAPPSDSRIAHNRITTEDHGVYTQAWYAPREAHRFNLGFRWDDNSQYGSATTVRAGYVGRFGRVTTKALYGEAFQEPNPRLLYGGWTGSGSDPDLQPEKSRTIELSGGYTTSSLNTLVSLFHVRNNDTIINTAAGAENLGEREVAGFDVHLRHDTGVGAHRMKSWLYYSRILRAEESSPDDANGGSADMRIGDLARNRVVAGVTADVTRDFTATLIGRWTGDRATIATNPVGEVDGFVTFDAAFVVDRIAGSSLGATMRIANLSDEEYFHPGVREASAGETPGRFEGGVWNGSAGFYNSLLPQPGRTVSFMLRFSGD
jgi:outer membrane receptor for ferrienterochelin and colicins